jgi:ankyrin repeat protein
VSAAVKAGSDVNAFHDGHTALHQQAWIGDVEMVEALLAAGADRTLLDDTYRATPLDWAEHGRQSETAALLRAAARINSTEK